MIFSEQHKKHMVLLTLHEYVKVKNGFGDNEKKFIEIMPLPAKPNFQLTRTAKTQENRTNKDTWIKELTLLVDPCPNITREGKYVEYLKEWYKIHAVEPIPGSDGDIYYLKLHLGLDALEKSHLSQVEKIN